VTTISLTEEKETLFITLRAKALDSRMEHSILHDDMAYEILQSIQYDFNKYTISNDDLMVIRARQYDEWVKEYLGNNKNTIVVYIGCGLDTRIARISPPTSVIWYDVDFPEVIKVRKSFFMDKPGYHMLAASATEAAWIMQIPNNKPALIIAEGVLEYFTFEEVKVLFKRLLDHFESGEIIFDVMNWVAVNLGKKGLKKATGAEHKWTVNDTSVIETISPRLKKVTELPLMASEYVHDLPSENRNIYRVMAMIPPFRNMMRLMWYRF
jgi:O-methyltransferase involved in polyketide biosynthesis